MVVGPRNVNRPVPDVRRPPADGLTDYSRRVIALIKTIPRGKVTTYGLIAAAAGNQCGARQVARLLHSSADKYRLPWQRVVNIKGRIPPRLSMGHVEQRQLLELEGIEFGDDDSIDFARFLWIP